VEWIILFMTSWLLFFFLVDWKQMKTNFWCGIMAVALQLTIDSQGVSHGLYGINGPVISFIGSSAFFVLGPVFTVGTLYAQYNPSKKWAVITNVLVMALLFSLMEHLLLLRKALVYLNWHGSDSYAVNVSAMVILSWFSIVVLNKIRRT
jgi:hypothetical protein